jgi:outer membrane protein
MFALRTVSKSATGAPARAALIALAIVAVTSLTAAPVMAQAAAPQRPGTAAPQRPAAPAGQPAQQPPAAQPPPAPPPPVPFPQGAKIGIVNLQTIASLSVEGKSSTSRIQALVQKKQTEAAAKSKALQDSQTKLQQQGALMNEAARTQLEKDIERMNVESMRFEQDAQAEITELQNELQAEFQRKLFPILDQIRKEKELHILLSAQESGAIVIEPGIDLTGEAIKRLDALSTSSAAPAPAAPKPAAPAPATPAPAPAKP